MNKLQQCAKLWCYYSSMIKRFQCRLFILYLILGINASTLAQTIATPDSLFTGYFRLNSGGWTAGDATLSVPLPDGRIIWLFGDSYLADVDTSTNTLPCLFQVRNCMLVQDTTNPEQLTTYIDGTQSGVLRSTFKLAPDDPSILWPGHGFTYLDTVFIFLDKIGPNMENNGVYLAKMILPGLEILGIYPLPEQNNILPGRAVMTDSTTGYRYIYGNKLNWIVWEPYVARIPSDGNPLLDYEYFNGTSWVADPLQAVKIMNDPVSPGFSVFSYDKKYYLLTQENGYLNCGLGRDIYLYESELPWGPFENKKTIYTIEDQFNGNYLLTYNAQAHPSFTDHSGLLVSYNLNDWTDTISPYVCPAQCLDVWHDRLDADTYRPKFIRYLMEEATAAYHYSKEKYSIIYPNPVERGSAIHWDSKIIERITLIRLDGSIVRAFDEQPLKAPMKPGCYLMVIYSSDGSEHHQKLVVY